MNKKRVNIGVILGLITTSYLVCYLLLEGILPFSISHIYNYLVQWVGPWHVLAVGLIPVYMALMIFGAAVVGIYLGSALQRLFKRLLQR